MATEPDERLSGGGPGAAARTRPGTLRPVPGLPPPASELSLEAAPAPTPDPYSSQLEDFTRLPGLRQGEIRDGRVVKVSGADVIVDIGYKSEGLIGLEQFRDALGQIRVQAGDVIDVMVETTFAQDGYIRLSHERAHRLRQWDRLEKAFFEKTPVTGLVVERVKGGLDVDLGGVRAFLPGSQADLRPKHNLDGWKGKEVSVRIIKLNKKRSNVVVSRRAGLEEEIQHRRQSALDSLEEGAVVPGTVKNLTDYGVFVDLGGIDGLLHVTDISYGRVSHPSEALHVGDPVTVKVLKFDRARERVSLGIKQLAPDPWAGIAERRPANSRVYGQVMNVTDYGAFVEIEPGVEGLIHVSDMTWSRRTRHPSKIVKRGDQVEVVVLDVNPRERRISLGLKQLEPNPWTTLAGRYSVGSVVEGRVRNLTEFGAFVEIEDGVDGLVHVSDISHSTQIKHPSEALRKGQRVQAAILRIDAENRRLSLGIKQLQPDAWELFFQNHTVGQVVRGKVTRHAGFGVFVELAEGIEGLCHSSEIAEGEKSPRLPPDGTVLDFKILKLRPGEKKIGLSLRAAVEAPPAPPQPPERAVAEPAVAEAVLSFTESEGY